MLKKAGMLTVGVTAGLLAVAPLANAGVAGDSDKDNNDDKKSSHDKDHGKKSHKGDDGDQKGTGNIKCSAESGDLDNDATGEGSLAGIGQVAGPVLSNNAGQILSCNSFLNENLNDNAISVGILGDAVAE